MERRSFDLIGDIGIIECHSKKEEKSLVKKIVKTYPRIKAILKKESEASGKFRLKKFRIVYRDKRRIAAAGLKETETIHKEFGCSYKMDVMKVFFNPRESTIRHRISNLVIPKERVLVMFSGIGPYPILIAKKVDCNVSGIEINPAAVEYAKENVRVNRVQERVELFQGDVRSFNAGKFSRIVMPLATDAYKYLDKAFTLLKKGGIIHLYGLGEKKAPYKDITEKMKAAAKQAKKRVRILDKRIVSPFSPARCKVCLDIQIY